MEAGAVPGRNHFFNGSNPVFQRAVYRSRYYPDSCPDNPALAMRLTAHHQSVTW
jgi:hypothetical protein